MTRGYPLWATVYCDASGNGNWAARVRYDRPPHRVMSWGESKYNGNSTAAELNAILQGVKLALETWPELEGVGVRSDCQSAIALAQWNAKLSKKPFLRSLQEELIRVRGSVKIRLVWVKGHQNPSKSQQAYLNDWCDKHCYSNERRNQE